jgi:hypothetical protein
LNILAIALLCCLRMQASHQHFGAFSFEFHALNWARDFYLLFRTKKQVKVTSRFRLVRLYYRIWGCNLFRNLFFRRNRRSYRDRRDSYCVLVRSPLVGCDLYTFLVSIINFDPVLVFVRHCLYCRLRCRVNLLLHFDVLNLFSLVFNLYALNGTFWKLLDHLNRWSVDSVERRSVQRGLDFIIRRFNVVDVFNPNAQLWLLGNL